MYKRLSVLLAVIVLLAAFALHARPVSATGLSVLDTTLISASPTGEPGASTAKGSYSPSMSSDGRYVVFSSASANLIPSATLSTRQAFLYDRTLHQMEIISRSSTGDMASGPSTPTGISDDGRYIVFYSSSNNLTANPPLSPTGSPQQAVYLRDRVAGTTTLISSATTQLPSYSQPHSISRDGSIVTYEAITHFATGGADNKTLITAYIYNRLDGTTTEVPGGAQQQSIAGDGQIPTVSGDGRYVTYSRAGVPPISGILPPTLNYRYDRLTGQSIQYDTGADAGAVLSNSGDYALYGVAHFNNVSGAYGYQWDVVLQNIQTGDRRVIISYPQDTLTPSVGSLSMSDDHNYVNYQSQPGTLVASNLTTNEKAVVTSSNVGTGQLSSDGSQIVYDGNLDTAPGFQVFVSRIGTQTSLSAPNNLSATSPTQIPTLHWDTVTNANIYNIYRDGTKIDSTAATSYVDNSAPDGAHTYYVTAADTSGLRTESIASNSTDVIADKTPPVLGAFTWQINPKTTAQLTSLTVLASDATTAVAGGEYYLGDTDPGQGKGVAMTLGSGSLTTVFDTSLQSGVYKVNVRAQDSVGNWSVPVIDYLVVYDPSSTLGVTGKDKKDFVPSLAAGDILPGLNSTTQTDVAAVGFTVGFKNGALNPNNSFQFSYSTGGNCKTPGPQSCQSFALSSTSFSWLVLDQTNSSRSQFQGLATVTVNGVVTTNPFNVTAVDGNRLTPQVNDTILLKVYAPGANPASASPIYQATGSLPRANSVVIR